MSVSPAQNFSNPPPVPDSPTVIFTSGFSCWNVSAAACANGKTVLEPSMLMLPLSFWALSPPDDEPPPESSPPHAATPSASAALHASAIVLVYFTLLPPQVPLNVRQADAARPGSLLPTSRRDVKSA